MSQPAITSRQVELATGLRYHILEAGNADADHTVFLVHGFLDLAWGWRRTIDNGLAQHFHIIAPDMRGHGDSDRIGAGGYYHFLDYLADLHELVTTLGRASVSLVGHSMGGTICGYYAGCYPDRVDKLVLMEGLGPRERSQSMPESVRQWHSSWALARQRQPQSYATLQDAAKRLQKYDPLLSDDVANELARDGTRTLASGDLIFKHDPLHLTRGPYPFRVTVAQDFWRNIDCPTLIIDGDKSHFRDYQTELDARAQTIAKREHHRLADAGHMMQRHQPEALAKVLIDFLGPTSLST